MGLLTLAGFGSFLWRFRWVFICIGIWLAYTIALNWFDGVLEERDRLRRETQELIITNQATMEALDALQAEKARNEALLKDRAARKSKEADQLAAIIKRLSTYDASKDCPVSPAIDDALDGM